MIESNIDNYTISHSLENTRNENIHDSVLDSFRALRQIVVCSENAKLVHVYI